VQKGVVREMPDFKSVMADAQVRNYLGALAPAAAAA
jgi:hypothetical protein